LWRHPTTTTPGTRCRSAGAVHPINSKARFAQLPGEVTELKQIVVGQRDEIARLKGHNGRPSIKPSGMENSTGLKRGGKRVKRRRRGRVTPLVVPETEVLRVEHPKGSQFKGYESFRPRVWCATDESAG